MVCLARRPHRFWCGHGDARWPTAVHLREAARVAPAQHRDQPDSGPCPQEIGPRPHRYAQLPGWSRRRWRHGSVSRNGCALDGPRACRGPHRGKRHDRKTGRFRWQARSPSLARVDGSASPSAQRLPGACPVSTRDVPRVGRGCTGRGDWQHGPESPVAVNTAGLKSGSREDMQRVNVDLVAELRAVAATGGGRVVHLGSAAEYGPDPSAEWVDATTPCQPVSRLRPDQVRRNAGCARGRRGGRSAAVSILRRIRRIR